MERAREGSQECVSRLTTRAIVVVDWSHCRWPNGISPAAIKLKDKRKLYCKQVSAVPVCAQAVGLGRANCATVFNIGSIPCFGPLWSVVGPLFDRRLVDKKQDCNGRCDGSQLHKEKQEVVA